MRLTNEETSFRNIIIIVDCMMTLTIYECKLICIIKWTNLRDQCHNNPLVLYIYILLMSHSIVNILSILSIPWQKHKVVWKKRYLESIKLSAIFPEQFLTLTFIETYPLASHQSYKSLSTASCLLPLGEVSVSLLLLLSRSAVSDS